MSNNSKSERDIPPAMLYKYYPVEDFLPKIFNGESLRFTCPLNFNDPFESHFGCRLDSFVDRKEFSKAAIENRGLSPAQRLMEEQRLQRAALNLQTTSSNPHNRAVIENIGVFCLSEVRNSTLMWSHYAKRHEGVCIGFQTSESLFKEACEVKYQDKLPVVISGSDDDETLHRKSVLTKALCWEYEKEWRIVWYMEEKLKRSLALSTKQALEDPQLIANGIGAGDYKFPKTAIREIYLGARIEAKPRADVLKAIRKANLNIPIYEIQVNPTQYRLDFRRYETQAEWRAL